MKNYELKELSKQELLDTNGGFGPLYYAAVAIWSAGVAYGYITNK